MAKTAFSLNEPAARGSTNTHLAFTTHADLDNLLAWQLCDAVRRAEVRKICMAAVACF